MQVTQKLSELTKSFKVLLVEDNQDAQKAIADLMSNFFDDITLANDGAEGLQKYHEGDFDLIVTDINMPNMSGLEMIKHIREENLHIAIIILTAYKDADYLLESIKYTVDGYIIKPINVKELHNTINKTVDILHSFRKNLEYEHHLEQLVEEKTKALIELANRDPMTNLYNRRYFNEISKTLFNLAKRDNQTLSLLMIDLDHFKKINDTYGHLVGDDVLQLTAKVLMRNTRECDIVIRFGGEEFVILLPNTTIKGALSIAEKIRSAIEKEELQLGNQKSIRVTASIGIATYENAVDTDIDALIIKSDKALYAAKESGRNCIKLQEGYQDES